MKSIASPASYLDKYQHIALEEDSPNDEHARVIYAKRPNTGLYICVIFLALGWAATIEYFYHSRFESNGLLHVYHNTPIPKAVFNPVKKVFNRDERYIGWNDEVNQNWDRLVAGTLEVSLRATRS